MNSFGRFSVPIFFSLGLTAASPTPSPVPAVPVPPENREPHPAKADTASLEAVAEKFAAQLLQPENAPVDDAFFFPKAAFIPLKAIPKPDVYFDQLLAEYRMQLGKMRQRLQQMPGLKFEGAKIGFCKWKAVGSEYNHIPYWSCYRSVLNFRTGDGKALAVGVRTWINWGRDWFITHLGTVTF